MEVKTTAPATTPRWGRSAPRFARGPAGARKFQMFLGRLSGRQHLTAAAVERNRTFPGNDQELTILEEPERKTLQAASSPIFRCASEPRADITFQRRS